MDYYFHLSKSILDKWRNEIPPSTSPSWNIIWHNHKAQKGATFLWSIIYKAMAVKEWYGWILIKIDKNCPRCSPLLVESAEHIVLVAC